MVVVPAAVAARLARSHRGHATALDDPAACLRRARQCPASQPVTTTQSSALDPNHRSYSMGWWPRPPPDNGRQYRNAAPLVRGADTDGDIHHRLQENTSPSVRAHESTPGGA